MSGVQQAGLHVLHRPGADQAGQDGFGRRRGIDVEGPRGDEALDAAMVLAQLFDRLGGPRRDRQHRGSAVGGRRAQVVDRDAVPVAVEIHAAGAGDQGEDAGIGLVVLQVGGVVELTALRDDQSPHSAVRVGQPRDGVGRRDFGAHPVETGLDRRDRGVAVRGVDKGADRGDHALVAQRLPDHGRRVTGLYLDDDVALAVARVVVAGPEHRVPEPGSDDDGDHHHDDEQPERDSAGVAPPSASAFGAIPGEAAHPAPGRPDRLGFGALALHAVNHPWPVRRGVHRASSAGSPRPRPGRSPPAGPWPASPPRAVTAGR